MTGILGAVLGSLGCAGPTATPDSGAADGPQVALEGQITDLLTGAGKSGVQICADGTDGCGAFAGGAAALALGGAVCCTTAALVEMLVPFA